jgi:hypothetical protein
VIAGPKNKIRIAFLLLTACLGPLSHAAAQWKPVTGHILTRWAKDVTPKNAWEEYPRPQMVRREWLNLNGLWDYGIQGESAEWKKGRIVNAQFDPLDRLVGANPPRWDGKILTPFAVESALSGVGKIVRPDQLLWYRRTFEIPAAWRGKRVVLHFEAVDWHSAVFVNGKKVGENKGGYVPFAFDITRALNYSGTQQIVVAVWDPSNEGDQSVGKQSLPEDRRGYRYTPTTGIWQTVWLEPVPSVSVDGLKIVPDVDRRQVRVTVAVRGDARGASVKVTALDGRRAVGSRSGRPGETVGVAIPGPKLWSPESPFLYGLKVELSRNNKTVDAVESYFGLRKIAFGRDRNGITRIFLNNKILPFQFGPLDQGYWPDGVLTPPSDKAAEADLRYLKDIACNMVRVHVNVRPDRWYYHCDRLGLLVWQDMVCTRKFDAKITPGSSRQWETEQRRMIGHLQNHPSVVEWIVFNEGWGQYDTERLTNWAMKLDPSRLVACASGWQDYEGLGHIRDIHDYTFYPSIPLPENEKGRAIVLGEFGGFDVALPGHLWHSDQKLELRSDPIVEGNRERYADGKEWLGRYQSWIRGWRQLIGDHGLCAGVYTQNADVEHELNGWLTYDRAVSKIDVPTLRRLHQTLYEPAPKVRVLLPNSKSEPQTWRYATAEPASDWFQPNFNDAGWKSGKGPFAGSAAVTPVMEKRIYLRRTFRLDGMPKQAAIRVYCRGDLSVYLNGRLVKGFSTRGVQKEIGASILPLTPDAVATLRSGENVIAVQAEMKDDPKFVDVGLIEMPE